jgi:hypothetical protein
MAYGPDHRIGLPRTHRLQSMVWILRLLRESMGDFCPVRVEPQRSANGLLLGPGKVGA